MTSLSREDCLYLASTYNAGRAGLDPVTVVSASSEANLEYEDTMSVADLDFECTADVCLEPDLSDWGREPFPAELEAALGADLPDAGGVSDVGLSDCGVDLTEPNADLSSASITGWLVELCADKDDAADAALSF